MAMKEDVTEFKNSQETDMLVDNSSVMLMKIDDIFEKNFLSDICLVVNGKEYPSHRLILSTSSNVFHVMLTSPLWNESSESRIVLQESKACADIFGQFLHYLYSGKIRINQTTVMPILTLADKYNVKDLGVLCIDYMCSHIAYAGAHNQLVSWMQYTLTCGHFQVAEACKKFVKWNIQLIADTDDFGNFDPELFISLLQQNDLIVKDEITLYKIAVRWLEIQKDRIHLEEENGDISNSESSATISKHLEQLTAAVMSNIRYPMMSPHQLAELLLSDLVNQYKEFFMEQMAIGMAYHSNEQTSSRVQAALASSNGRLLFTPRLYTADTYSSALTIDKLHSIPAFHTRTLVFSSRVQMSISQEHKSKQFVEWAVDVYPKGVWFRKFYLIVWQGTVEVPENIMRTVRVSVSCRDLACVRVKIGCLILGVRDNIEHVMHVVEKHHRFDDNNQVLNFDDLIDFDAINLPPGQGNQNIQPNCPYLLGPKFDTLKLHIVVAPLSEFSNLVSPPFNFS